MKTTPATELPDRLRSCAPLTDKQWEKIKAALEDVGVVPDAVMIDDKTTDGLISHSLRERLPFMAFLCVGDANAKRLTPKQMVDDLDQTIKLARQLHKRLPFRGIVGSRRAQAELEILIRQSKRRRGEVSAMGDRRNTTAHNLFWKELMAIWNANVSKGTWRHNHLERFLIACSEPFFPRETTGKGNNRICRAPRAFPQISNRFDTLFAGTNHMTQ